jgi:hypothetical protein
VRVPHGFRNRKARGIAPRRLTWLWPVLATASVPGTTHLWDVAACAEIRRLNGHENWVGSLVFSRTGKELITRWADHSSRQRRCSVAALHAMQCNAVQRRLSRVVAMM